MKWQESLSWPRLVLFLALVFLLLIFGEPYAHRAFRDVAPQPPVDKEVEAWCPLPELVSYPEDGVAASEILFTKEVLALQVERLSAAVNVSTVSYGDNGDVESDPRWKTFEELHKVLRQLFPLVHQKVELEKINKYGLLYTLKGSSSKLKPVVFMAHQDVVPVPEPSKWTHPPFSAFYDGQWLWGRGSVDCKGYMIALLSTLEKLLEQDYQNKRTIIFSFGFDEETGGQRGAKHLAVRLEEKLGKGGAAMILDEGGMGIETLGDVAYAFPATAEKGYLDIVLTLDVPGGHSSKPPPHSAIGIMSDFVLALENNPFSPLVDNTSPYRNVLECQAKHSSHDVESWLKDALKDKKDLTLGQRLVDSRGDSARWLMQTSQAVDIIQGGVKDNQLPERVTTTINYRVLPSNTIEDILRRVADTLAPVAYNHSISMTGFGHDDIPYKGGLLNLTYTDRLSPSPIAPSGATDKSGIWNVFAATISQVYTNTTSPNSHSPSRLVIPVGTLMTGNTDTIHYWGLTENIYRFSPRREGSAIGVHTVDERIDMLSHVEAMVLYYELIRNLDRFEDV